MVHAALLLRPGHGQGAEPLLLHARHRHPILGLKLAVPRRLDDVHTLRWWLLHFRFEAAPHLGDRKAEQTGVNGSGTEVHAIYLQRPKVTPLPANLHECWRIAQEFTVRPDTDVTERRRRRFGVKF